MEGLSKYVDTRFVTDDHEYIFQTSKEDKLHASHLKLCVAHRASFVYRVRTTNYTTCLPANLPDRQNVLENLELSSGAKSRDKMH